MSGAQWEVEFTDQWGAWYRGLTEEAQEKVTARVDVLAERGPGLGRPLVDTVEGSAYPHMKELRVGAIRILFCFGPRQTAILLIGGNKRDHWSEWYVENVPLADQLYQCYLDELREEGLL